MAYRNKTYVCFDADTDKRYYDLMTAWNENERIAFDFQNAHEINNLRGTSAEVTIKRKLRERLKNTKVLVVLIGENTKNLYKYVRWEIEIALEDDMPIICANLNKKNGRNESLCPPILRKELAIHVPYGQRQLDYALNNWPSSHAAHRKAKESGSYRYSKFD